MLKEFKGSRDEDSNKLKEEIKTLRERLLAQQQLVRDKNLPIIAGIAKTFQPLLGGHLLPRIFRIPDHECIETVPLLKRSHLSEQAPALFRGMVEGTSAHNIDYIAS